MVGKSLSDQTLNQRRTLYELVGEAEFLASWASDPPRTNWDRLRASLKESWCLAGEKRQQIYTRLGLQVILIDGPSTADHRDFQERMNFLLAARDEEIASLKAEIERLESLKIVEA